MKKIFSLAIAAIAMFAACDNGVEDWQRPSGGGTTPGPVSPSINAEGWAALADSTTYVLVYNFLDRGTGTFYASPNNSKHDTDYIYWQQAHAMDVLIYSYLRIKDSEPSLAATYKEYFEKFYTHDANNYNHSHKSDGAYGGYFNDWTDDMAWLCLTLMHMSDATGIAKYADTARDIYDNYIWTRSTKCDKGTCLPWTNHDEDKTNFNACTNTPSCLVAALLYMRYKQESYLKNAKDLYEFNVKNMYDGERVENPALTYTQGTFGEAARILYHLTGDKSYMDMAGKVILYAFQGSACTSNGLLRHEGESMDQSIFKAVLIPYAVNYVLDADADTYTAASIKEKLLFNAKTLAKNLNRQAYPCMYASYYWGDKLNVTDVVSMGAHCSGASLIEGVARMTAE